LPDKEEVEIMKLALKITCLLGILILHKAFASPQKEQVQQSVKEFQHNLTTWVTTHVPLAG
jgi:hypothetical protein